MGRKGIETLVGFFVLLGLLILAAGAKRWIIVAAIGSADRPASTVE